MHGRLSTLSGLGFIASLTWYLAARAGAAKGLPQYATLIIIGIFVLGVATVVSVMRLAKSHPPTRFAWMHALSGASPWLIGLAVLSILVALYSWLVFCPSKPVRDEAMAGICASATVLSGYAIFWAVNNGVARRQAVNPAR